MNAYPQHAHGFYIDEPFCTEVLCDHVKFKDLIWDPACGTGTICEVLAARGYDTRGSDLIDRGYGETDFDFIDHYSFRESANIVMNPPYGRAKLARAFIEHALPLTTRTLAVLVNTRFLYSEGRYGFFTDRATKPHTILHLSNRPSMPPGDMLLEGKIKRGGGPADYCWLIWHQHKWLKGATRTEWGLKS